MSKSETNSKFEFRKLGFVSGFGFRASKFYWFSLICIATIAFVIVLVATRWGIATSSDSARYIRSARHVLGRETQVASPIEAPAEQAHYPPLYSTVLAIASLGGADPLHAARWLHALLLAANAIVAAEIVRRFTGATGAALFTAAAIAATPGSLIVHTMALSEALFIFLSFLSLGLLAAHLRRPRTGMLIAAALLAGAGMLTRYAGVSLLAAGVVILLMQRRWRDVAIFAAFALLLPAAWSVRNALVLGSATNRVIAFHPVTFGHLIDLAQVCWNWLGWDRPVNVVLTILAALLALVVAAIGWRGRSSDHAASLSRVLVIYIVVTGLVLIASISFVDFHTPIDTRILSPVYAAWVVLAGCALARAKVPVLVFAIALLAWLAVRSSLQVQQLFRDGGGYASPRWRNSRTLAALRPIAQDKWIYTNAPGAVYLLTGRPIIVTVPALYSASSRLPRPEFEADVERMRDDLHSGRAILVYLNRPAASQGYALTEAQLKKRFGLHPIARCNDGGIYDYVAPATTRSSPP